MPRWWVWGWTAERVPDAGFLGRKATMTERYSPVAASSGRKLRADAQIMKLRQGGVTHAKHRN